MTLLKDRPECAERIENSLTIKDQIKDAISNASFSFELVNNEVTGELDDPSAIVDLILVSVKEFIEDNYTWKGIQK